MAKKSTVEKHKRREKTIAKYAKKRADLLENRYTMGHEAFHAAIAKQPRDASATRHRNRCWMTGRPRGVYKKFGLCRAKIRELVMSGMIPGVVKSSW